MVDKEQVTPWVGLLEISYVSLTSSTHLFWKWQPYLPVSMNVLLTLFSTCLPHGGQIQSNKTDCLFLLFYFKGEETVLRFLMVMGQNCFICPVLKSYWQG